MGGVHIFRMILESKCTDYCSKVKYNLQEEGTKIPIDEIPELPSSHKCTKCAAILRAISSETNPNTSWLTPTHRETKKVLSLIRVGKVKTHFP